MAARMVQIFLPDARSGELETLLARHSRRYWRETVPGGQEKYSCIVQQRYTERLLDELDGTFSSNPNFAVYVSKLEAAIPPIVETLDTRLPLDADLPDPSALERFFSRDRLSTDELYDDIDENLHIRPTYLLTVILSAIIAGLGMRSGQTAVVIGAMIIAPLLGPTMGLALAATTGSERIGRKAALTLGVGCFCAILAGLLLGLTLSIDPMVDELKNRTLVQPADIALALACGAAGVLAFSKGTSLSLVGVMIAVALVPPLAATGIYVGAGYPEAGANALFLFAVNLVCVNVAGIATFLLQGLPPRNWRLTGGILALWAGLLLLLMSMMAGHVFLGLGSLDPVMDYLKANI